jgi:hypothetical protein
MEKHYALGLDIPAKIDGFLLTFQALGISMRLQKCLGRTGRGPCPVEPGKTIMRTALLLIPNLVLASQLFWTNLASAASGPLAEGFGRDAWLDKLHVVGGVVLLVAALTVFLVLMILKSR